MTDDGNFDVVIACDYKGYDPLNIPFSEARCTQIKYHPKYHITIKITYLGKYINDWQKIEKETDNFLNKFITKEEK